ncbi:MAG: hypothetical protein K9K38_04210 [Rhodoferax sp.]|nr:hypothetical protein [Rhodoferax sp.]MCF8208597.1 hypothetical protein [Rhodoferax sp.]
MTSDPPHEEAQKLISVSEQVPPLRSLAIFSHEARSTLHNMLGYIRLMQMNAPGDMIEHLVVVEDCSSRLLSLVDDLAASNMRVGKLPAQVDEVPADAATSNAAALMPLASLELMALEKMMLTGRLPRINEWASALAESYPEQRCAARRVVQLTMNADLPALEKMLAQWRALAR